MPSYSPEVVVLPHLVVEVIAKEVFGTRGRLKVTSIEIRSRSGSTETPAIRGPILLAELEWLYLGLQLNRRVQLGQGALSPVVLLDVLVQRYSGGQWHWVRLKLIGLWRASRGGGLIVKVGGDLGQVILRVGQIVHHFLLLLSAKEFRLIRKSTLLVCPPPLGHFEWLRNGQRSTASPRTGGLAPQISGRIKESGTVS